MEWQRTRWKLRCPAHLSAEGQYRTKQATYRLPGVRNEQVLPPEGKVCSGLHGDMQRLTETINPAFRKLVTDTMVRLIGWAGNMTLSNAFLQGILTS